LGSTSPLDALTIHWALSNDGTKLARSALSDVTITDLKQNKVIWAKQFPTNEVALVNSVAFSPDEKFLAVALRYDGKRLVKSDVGKVQIWDVASDEKVFSAWPLVTYVTSAAFSPNGELFAAGGFRLEAWDSSTFKTLVSLPPENSPSRHFPIGSFAFNAAGTRIATGGSDGLVCIWNATDGTVLSKLQGPLGEVRAVSFSGDETKLAAVGCDKTILIWSLPLEGREALQPRRQLQKE